MMIVDANSIAVVDGEVDDVWICDECLRLWQCRRSLAFPGKAWGKPSWFVRIRFRKYKHPNIGLSIFDQNSAVDPWENSPIPEIR
jgi:hypothetical protein